MRKLLYLALAVGLTFVIVLNLTPSAPTAPYNGLPAYKAAPPNPTYAQPRKLEKGESLIFTDGSRYALIEYKIDGSWGCATNSPTNSSCGNGVGVSGEGGSTLFSWINENERVQFATTTNEPGQIHLSKEDWYVTTLPETIAP